MNSIDQFLLFFALPTVVIASLVEAAVLSYRGSCDWRAVALSLFDLVLRVGIRRLLPLTLAAPLIALAYQHRLMTIALDGVFALLVLFIGQEFCYY